MKKEYIKPRMIAIDVASCENILQSSYVDIGGTTDIFNARYRFPYEKYDEYDDEIEEE